MISLLYLIISAVVVLADKLFKLWVSTNMETGQVIQLIPGVVRLTYIRNTGAAFGMLADMRWLLIVFSIAGVLALLYVLIKFKMGAFGKICVAAILGGGVGNALDRIFEGSVVDMFEFEFVRFYVFNIADIFVTVGVIAFCVYYIVYISKQEKLSVAKAESISAAVIDEESHDETHEYTEAEILNEYHMENLLNEEERDEGNGKG